MNTMTLIGVPVRRSPGTTPTIASGIVNKMMNGWMSDSNVAAITRYTRKTARMSAKRRLRNDTCISRFWPPISASDAARRRRRRAQARRRCRRRPRPGCVPDRFAGDDRGALLLKRWISARPRAEAHVGDRRQPTGTPSRSATRGSRCRSTVSRSSSRLRTRMSICRSSPCSASDRALHAVLQRVRQRAPCRARGREARSRSNTTGARDCRLRARAQRRRCPALRAKLASEPLRVVARVLQVLAVENELDRRLEAEVGRVPSLVVEIGNRRESLRARRSSERAPRDRVAAVLHHHVQLTEVLVSSCAARDRPPPAGCRRSRRSARQRAPARRISSIARSTRSVAASGVPSGSATSK